MLRWTAWVQVALFSITATTMVTAETPESPFTAMTTSIENGDYRKIEGVLVERGGVTTYEHYFRRSKIDSRIDARSAGKSITALALGIAIDDGLIKGVDEPVLSFFDDKKPIEHDDTVKRAITIEDFLTMSSALDCSDWRKSPGNEERMYKTEDWTRFALDIPLDADYERGPDGAGRYSYCTAGVFLLGRIIEHASGQPFDEFVQSRLFEPLGIEDAIWRRAPNGEVQSGGQLSLRARDFAAIGRLVLNRGVHEDQQIVSREWLRQMFVPRRRATPVDAYSYLWWIRNFHHADQPHPGLYMSGNGGNKIVLFPELDAIVVVLSTNYNRRDMHDLTTNLIQKYILPTLID